jgi:superfamily II DNA or RNA helicase
VSELRPYQEKAINLIRQNYAKGIKKVLLHLATGAGKTHIFCQVLKGAQAKGKSAIMVVRGRKLVDQASKRLDREGVQHGVFMANHKRFNPEHKIQVCSIDTLVSREARPEADIIVLDEAHYATSPSYKAFLANYPNAYILPVTATPYTDKGLRHVADTIVQPITTKELTDLGYLAPARYFTRSIPNLKGVKTTNGKDGKDFAQNDLAMIMEQSTLVGDIATHWKERANGRPSIAFCVNVSHSMKLTSYLNESGIRAAHVDASHSDEEREDIIRQLVAGQIDIICNCGILCTGVDIPEVSCIILARPTKSLNLHIQQIGRGTRPLPDKKDFIVLDHAGNVLRHGFLTDEHEANLDEESENKKEKKKVTKTCDICYAVFVGSVCPECGNMNEAKARAYSSVDGNLEELKPEDMDPVKVRIEELKKIQKERGYKRGWIYFKIKDEFGEIIANRHFPKRVVPSWVLRRGA